MLIGGYQPFSLSDYPGRTAAIIFTCGCNYRCPFCHNKQLWQKGAGNGFIVAEEAVLEHLDGRKRVLDGVVITGGEPTIQCDLSEFIGKLKKIGLLVKLDTNGSCPEVVASLITEGLVDYIAMDIKAPPEKYALLAGCAADFADIEASVDIIRNSTVRHHFRTTFFQELLTKDDIAAIQSLVADEKLLVQDCRR